MQNLTDFKLILAFFGFTFALCSFLYKNHETNQLRILKNITDNIKEINKICIEVFAKKNMTSDVYPKISMYLDFLQLDLKTFPAGYFYQLNSKFEKNRIEIGYLIEDYKEFILNDTPIENKSMNIEEYPDPEEKLDKIIQQSISILEELEKHLP